MESRARAAVEEETFAARRTFFVFLGILTLVAALVGCLSWPPA
ncbi:MAG: hypothetical protein VX387_07295 [Planctomycetota bacterium]|nr:hypothetical protein [Planctomycetota bacterium]